MASVLRTGGPRTPDRAEDPWTPRRCLDGPTMPKLPNPRWVGARVFHGRTFVVRGHAPTTSWKEGCVWFSWFEGTRGGWIAVVVERVPVQLQEMGAIADIGGGDGDRNCFVMRTAQGQLGEEYYSVALKLYIRIESFSVYTNRLMKPYIPAHYMTVLVGKRSPSRLVLQVLHEWAGFQDHLSSLSNLHISVSIRCPGARWSGWRTGWRRNWSDRSAS